MGQSVGLYADFMRPRGFHAALFHPLLSVRRGSTTLSWRDEVDAGPEPRANVTHTASVHLEPVLTDFFARHSLSAAQGRNIVNVILVDFRALDTLGEITVLAVAGFGVYALLRLKASHKGELKK